MSHFYVLKNMFPVTIRLFILPWKHSLVPDNPETRRKKKGLTSFYFTDSAPAPTQAYQSQDLRLENFNITC